MTLALDATGSGQTSLSQNLTASDSAACGSLAPSATDSKDARVCDLHGASVGSDVPCAIQVSEKRSE